jgi:signal transduction histidine kinase
MERKKNEEEQKQGKEEDINEQDNDSIELLTRARISFAATEEIVGEPEVQSPSAEQAEQDEMKQYLDEVLKETSLLAHTRLLEKAADNKEIRSSAKALKSINVLESIKRSVKMVREEIFPNKKITVTTIDNISRATVNSDNKNNNDNIDVYNVMADELLDELFLNLITNAVKYTDSNDVPIEITVDTEDYNSNGNKRLKITVADFGHGIPDHLKEIIFERYDETAPISSGPAEGSSLSLFIVKKLIDSYKGEISLGNRVQDDYSKGTVFTLSLPLASS